MRWTEQSEQLRHEYMPLPWHTFLQLSTTIYNFVQLSTAFYIFLQLSTAFYNFHVLESLGQLKQELCQLQVWEEV